MSGSQLNSSIGLTALNNQQQKPDSRQQQIRPTLNQNTVIAPIPQSNQHFHQQLPSQTSTPIVSNIHINPLSNPKGVKLVCELCAKPAYIQCKGCRLTYYCDKEHETVDWKGIHERICSHLIPLRTPVAVFGSEEERAQREKQKRHRQIKLLEITKMEAHKKLFEEQFEYAIPAALQALRFAMEVYGKDSIELVPSYLLLGEASVGLKQYSQAEDYLSLAKWAVMKAEKDCNPRVRAQLHRNLGLLYLAKHEYDDAAKQFARDIYFSSVGANAQHFTASGGYFQLGNVFQRQRKTDEAHAFFEKVIVIWKLYLKQEVKEKLDEAQQVEAIKTVNHIFAFRKAHVKALTAHAEALYVLSQLYLLGGNVPKAKDNAELSLELYEQALGREHSQTVELRVYLKSL